MRRTEGRRPPSGRAQRGEAERSAPECGFTLLEVLAAVAILGILYTVLMGVAIQGRMAEGMSRRRLEASLIADRQMAELEMQIDAGAVPDLGETELDADPYTVRLRVEPFDLLIEGTENERGLLEPALSNLTSDGSSPLREIEITVSWMEGDSEHHVIRTSYGLATSSLDTSRLSGPGGNSLGPAGGEQAQGGEG
jgi:prepilin-type N-terminal cleavage/methylation domain-containing protein